MNPVLFLLALPFLVVAVVSLSMARSARTAVAGAADKRVISRWLFRSGCYLAAAAIWVIAAFGGVSGVVAGFVALGLLVASVGPLRSLDDH